MTLRLSRHQVRFRLTPEEFARLREGHAIEETTCFPGQAALRYRVEAVADIELPPKHPLKLELSGNWLRLSVTRTALLALAERLPSRDGIEWREQGQHGVMMHYALDVDVKG